MLKRIKLKGGDEYDALTKARKYYRYLEKPGKAKRVKQRYNKRFRRAVKTEISNEIDEI